MELSSFSDFVESIAWRGPVLILGIVVGLGLLAFGRKLARPTLATAGLLLAGLGGAVLSTYWPSPGIKLGLIVGLGLVGGLATYLLFRVWMGIAFGLILAGILPLAASAWSPPPPKASVEEPPAHIAESAPAAETEANSSDGASRWIALLRAPQQRIIDFWHDLGAKHQRQIYVASGAGALIGLVLGLVAPYASASITCALGGAALLVSCAIRLVELENKSIPAWLPSSGLGLFWLIGPITLIGAAVQWTIFHRQADT